MWPNITNICRRRFVSIADSLCWARTLQRHATFIQGNWRRSMYRDLLHKENRSARNFYLISSLASKITTQTQRNEQKTAEKEEEKESEKEYK